jgi:hypothetical protein
MLIMLLYLITLTFRKIKCLWWLSPQHIDLVGRGQGLSGMGQEILIQHTIIIYDIRRNNLIQHKNVYMGLF